MSSIFDRKKILPRFKFFAYIILLLGLIVIGKATYIATAQREYWTKVSSKLHKEGVETTPVRGNILSDDGRIMASSLPEYILYMDFKAVKAAGNDSLLLANMDSICDGLHEIFPDRTAAEFKKGMMEGYDNDEQNYKIYGNKHVTHNIYAQVKALPVFRLHPYKGGFHVQDFNARQHPHGSLAFRTIGTLYGAKDSAKCGLELYYDSILRGENGIVNRQKVMNKYLSLTVKEPVDGADVVTTLNVDIQDLAERAMLDELREINGDVGVVIVMETKTGDVKAMVNMSKLADGNYAEIKNNAVSDLLEPGSVFKTASMMVALDDGVCDTNYVVQTGSGVKDMYGAKMRDHNWAHGGCGTVNMVKAMEKSSNIGISCIIDRHYKKNPEKYVEGLYRLGLHDDLKLPFFGYANSNIKMPERNGKGNLTNWPLTTLPWMSIGYETQVPPMQTVTFYNAIANGGKMMRPRFVQRIEKNGEVLEEFQPEVMREQIAKPTTIEKITKILTSVVKRGTGKKAGSKLFSVAGKTGTAQIASGGGYKKGIMHYLISFCGFFPAEDPQYTCIVCIQKAGAASGGVMCGKVFHEVSEGIMSQQLRHEAVDAKDLEERIENPNVKNGNIGAAGYVLDQLGIQIDSNFQNNYHAKGQTAWGQATAQVANVRLREEKEQKKGLVPDVYGMGARDAVFILENCGLKVKIQGRGKVQSQSIVAGEKVKKGTVCHIVLG